MNILVISTVSYRANGIANVIRNLYVNDTFHNENMFFLFPLDNDESMISDLKNSGYKVFEFPRNKKNTIQYFCQVYHMVKSNHIQIVHIHGNSHSVTIELLASFLAGCKIRICHSHNTTCTHKAIHRLLTPAFGLLCTDRFACGEEAGRWMYGNKEFRVVKNGIDTERFRYRENDRERVRFQYKIGEDEFIIGHIGNLNRQKNQAFLIELIADINLNRACKCLLVGEGENKDDLEKMVKDLGLEEKVFFCGTTKDVPAYLSAIDVIVMPSLYEGLPLSLIEAQASGLDCVVSGVITKEVNLTGKVYYVNNLNSKEDWLKEIEGKDIKKDRNKYSQNAINIIRSSGYDIKAEVQELYEYYKDKVRSKPIGG